MSTYVRSGSASATLGWSHHFNFAAGAETKAPPPEIEIPDDEIVIIVQASGSKDKLLDARRALSGHDTYVMTAKDFLGRTVPDDDENASSQYQIVKDKIDTTVRNIWNVMTPEEKEACMIHLRDVLSMRARDELQGAELQARLAKIAKITPANVVLSSEDRAADIDKTLRDHALVSDLWDDLRYSHDPLVREAFARDHDFPGKRFKEVMSAAGGSVYLLAKEAEAKRILDENKVPYSEEHGLRVVSRYEVLEAGKVHGLDPENALIVESYETGFRYRDLTEADWRETEKGIEFDFSHFEVPNTPEAEGVDARGNRKTIDTLREAESSHYLNNHYAPSAVLHEFARAAGLPVLEKPRKYGRVNLAEANIITNENIGEWLEHVPTPETVAGRAVSRYRARIESLATLEQTFYRGDALVIRDPNNLPVPPGVGEAEFRLVKNLEARLLFSYWAMLKPHGSSQVAGRPILVEQSFADRELGYYADYSNRKTISHPSKEVWDTFDGTAADGGEADIAAKLKWDPDRYKHNPANEADIPEFHMMDMGELQQITGVDDFGFSMGGITTASSKIIEAGRETYVGAGLAAKHRITYFSGGGAREGMMRLNDAYVDAHAAGYDVGTAIGVRVDVVSHNEGSMADYIKRRDLVANGDPLNDYFTFSEGRVHVLNKAHMCERQHAVLGPTHVVQKFIGGIGTENEAETIMLHNAYVNVRGYGMFPGFDNIRTKELHVVNTLIVNGKTAGYYDRGLSDISPESREFMHMTVVPNAQASFAHAMGYAHKLGYDIQIVPDALTPDLLDGKITQPPNADYPHGISLAGFKTLPHSMAAVAMTPQPQIP